MKNKILLVLILCFAVAAVYGAGGRDARTEGNREVTLCMSQVRFGSSVDDRLIRSWTDVIERATNTRITPITPTHNDFNDRLMVMLASGDYPDIIRPQQAWDVVSQLAVRGHLQPVTRFINNDSRFALLRNYDLTMYQSGQDIYGIPTNMGNGKIFFFRQDMIQRYNLQITDTMTTDEFVRELRKVNRNEVIPFTFPRFIVNMQIFYNVFGAWGGIWNRNGQYIDGIQTPEFREALLFVRSLYDEGLMDREFITNDNMVMRDKFTSGRAASLIDYASRYAFFVETSERVNASTQFIPVYTLVGPRGDRGNLNESGGEAMTLSVRNRNVEASMDIIHWLFFTEAGRKHDALGVEGVHFNVANNVLVPTPAAAASGYAVMHSWLGDGHVNVPFESLGFGFQGISSGVLTNMLNYIRTSLDPRYLGPMHSISMGVSSIYDESIASYNAHMYEMATRVVMGTQSIDAAYADHARFWTSIRGDEMLRQLNARR